MNDRALLELAAKAAGYTIVDRCDLPSNQCDLIWNAGAIGCKGAFCWNGEEDSPWYPLTDDGDALRLAIKLGLESGFNLDSQQVCYSYMDDAYDRHLFSEYFTDHTNNYAATRRAIVRAAASIGEQMK